MLGWQQIVPGDAVHLTCPLTLEDDAAYTSGVLQHPPHVLLVAKNNTVEVYELDLSTGEVDAPVSASSSTSSAPSSSAGSFDADDTTKALRSLGHIIDFGSPVLAMVSISHQCFVALTAEQELVVLRYQGNLPGGQEDVVGHGPAGTTNLVQLKNGVPCVPGEMDWTAEAGQHWSGLHHRLHWMVIHHTRLRPEAPTASQTRVPCADPHLHALCHSPHTVVAANVYEGAVHRVIITFHPVTSAEQLVGTAQHYRPSHVRVLDNFYADRWTGLNAAANYTVGTIRHPEPFTSAGLSSAVKGESSAARRQRVDAQWQSFWYEDIADEELLLRRSIAELAAHKAMTTEHLPSWRVNRDQRLPDVTVEVTKLRETCGEARVLPIPSLHSADYPSTVQWVLHNVHKPYLCVYRHPASDPAKIQCFQQPQAQKDVMPVYLALTVPADSSATAAPPSASDRIVLFQQTADGTHRIRVENLSTFRMGLVPSTGTAVASCPERPVSAVVLASTASPLVLWLALDTGKLSCVPLPSPITDTADPVMADAADSGDCDPRPWPTAPTVSGLPAHFHVRTVRPLDLASSASSTHFLYSTTSRYAIMDDALCETFVVDLVARQVVAALSSRGAMTSVCEGVNHSLVTAHIGGQLSRLIAVTPTRLLARLGVSHSTSASTAHQITAVTSEDEEAGAVSSSSFFSAVAPSIPSASRSPSLRPRQAHAAPHVVDHADVDGIFPLLLGTSSARCEGGAVLHVLVSSNSRSSMLYRCTFEVDDQENAEASRHGEVATLPASEMELSSARGVAWLRRLERVAVSVSVDSPGVALMTASSTLAAITTHRSHALLQCTRTHYSAYGHVTALKGEAWLAALCEVEALEEDVDEARTFEGGVAALVYAAREATVVLHALTPSPPSTVHSVADSTEVPVGGAVSAIAVSAAAYAQGQATVWRVCVLAALWNGCLRVHLLHYSEEEGWVAQDHHHLEHGPAGAASVSRPPSPFPTPHVIHQFVRVPNTSSSATRGGGATCAEMWCPQWVATVRAGGLTGSAGPAQVIDVRAHVGLSSELTSVQWSCLPSAEGPTGMSPLAQIAAPVVALNMRCGAMSFRQTPLSGGLHVALMHESYAELFTFAGPPTTLDPAAGSLHPPKPTASIRVDAHATQPHAHASSSSAVSSSASPCLFATHWRACAVVACTPDNGRSRTRPSAVTHVLFAASTNGGIVVVGLPDLLVPTSAASPDLVVDPQSCAEPVWELSTVTPPCYQYAQRTTLPGLSATDTLVRVLPSAPVAALRGTITLAPHICCVDRGPATSSLVMAVCPVELQAIDALPLRHTSAVDGVTHELIATCMERVPERDGDSAYPVTTSPGSDLVLVGSRSVGEDLCATRSVTSAASHASPSSHWLLVLASSPLRVVTAVSVPVTSPANASGSARVGITDMALYRRPSPPAETSTASRQSGVLPPGSVAEAAVGADHACVLVVVAGGTSVFLYQLYGRTLVAISKVNCRAMCTSIALAYPSISVGLGGDGFAYLWVLSLSEGGDKKRHKARLQNVEGDRTTRSSAHSHERSNTDGARASDDDDGDDTVRDTAVPGALSRRSRRGVEDLNAILHRSDAREALAGERASDDRSQRARSDSDGSGEGGDEDDGESHPAQPLPRDDGTTPFNPEEERKRRFGQSKLATLHSAPAGLSLILGAYEPAVLSGHTQQRSYRERFVRTDERGGVSLVYPHPPTSLTQMHQSSVGMHGGTSCTMTHCLRLPSPATSISVANPLRCRSVRRAQPRALQWSERWVALCAAGAGPRAILIPCVDGSLHLLTEVPYGLAHPLLRLEQVLTDLRTHCLVPHCDPHTDTTDFHYTYHIKPYAEDTALKSATRLVPKQGVVNLDTLRAFFAWREHMHALTSTAHCARAVIALDQAVQLAENALFEEYGDDLTLDDCEEMIASA